MPELPEVETVARGLARRLTGCTIERVLLSRSDIVHGERAAFVSSLADCRIESVGRRGKQVLIRLERGISMIVHLGMSGRLILADPDDPLAPHTHCRFVIAGERTELRFCDPRRFGGIWLLNGTGESSPQWVGRRLPPVAADPLELSLREWRSLLGRRRQIKALLLDQQPISGLGNIYCDEALHRAGIHPLTRADELDEAAVQRLRRATRRVLTEAINAGGSSVSDYRNADNAPGWFQVKHRVYNRTGRPCRRCRSKIERIVVAGRGTHVCLTCQPPPRRNGLAKTKRRR